MEYVALKHVDFSVQPAGLFINPLHPHLGASPDGMISCECCGNGVLEIKCTYKYKDELPTSAIALSDRNYCLKQDETGKIIFSNSHQYYDQVQGQMAICNLRTEVFL